MSERQAPYPVGSPPIALMQCPIAGFQFHGGEACFDRIRIDDRLDLHREPGNRHDPRAITVQWQGVMLGYVPREANYALSQMMDRGAQAQARVKSLREGADPWQRVMMEVCVHAAAAAEARAARQMAEVVLSPPRELAVPALKLAPAPEEITAAQRETCIAVLRDCLPEIARRLTRPVTGFVHEELREVFLWDTVALQIGANGHGLSAYYVEGTAPGGPSLTVDLKQPLGVEGWVACFVPAIGAVCARHGLSKANMSEALQRWVGDSLRLTFEAAFDFEALRRKAVDFLAPDPLARSLANRIFGRLDSRLRGNDDARLRGNDNARLRGNDDASPSADAFNWACTHAPALALCGVEQPAMLPFLRLVQDDKAMRTAPDPLAALRERLIAEGLEPAAWKKLARWTFDAFERIGPAWWKPIPFARFANLLHRVDVQAPVPPHFALHARRAALHRAGHHEWPDFERHPPWFMRALLREVEQAADDIVHTVVRDDLLGCVDWLLDAPPEPDANQQRAGWAWIVDQSRGHRQARELAMFEPWAVPVAGMLWGPYRVVAIECPAELVAEAEAMKNCLVSYGEACWLGDLVVYSIRQRSTGARVACFAAERAGASWRLIEVVGKMNASVDDELERIGHAMVVKLNGGRGGEVAPF